jgi:hypothetical protein
VARDKKGGFGTTLVFALIVVIVAMVLGVGIARYGDQVSWLAPLLGKPTQTTSDVAVQDIQRLNQLATVKVTEQVVVEEDGSGKIYSRVLPNFLTGEKILLIAVGDVQAGVNLNDLRKDDVRVEGDKVTINLPKAEILSTSLDEDKTRIYDRQRGLLRLRGDDALIQEAHKDAVDELQAAAQKNGTIEQAQKNAEDGIRAFLTTLGYKEVVFE